MLYTRPQLVVILLVVLTAGIGLGVGHWRRGHPEIVERLERLDRADAPADATDHPSTPAARPPREVRPRSERSSGADVMVRRTAPQKTTPPAQPIDVNHASQDDLRTLPGIGGVLAARIVEAREREGPFASMDDLRRVRGLGRSKLDRLATFIAIGP